MPLTRKVVDLLSSRTRTEEPDDDAEPAPTRSSLYECRNCETTLIAEDLENCPTCERSVDRVPNEKDLGLL